MFMFYADNVSLYISDERNIQSASTKRTDLLPIGET